MKVRKQEAVTGTLFLIPVPLAQDGMEVISQQVISRAVGLKHFFAENIRSARRVLRAMDAQVDIDSIHFSEMNKQQDPDISLLHQWLKAGKEVGVMSEAGCPGIADPGSRLVEAARDVQARIVPMAGPNAMLLALMGSGFNGQAFRFSGYPPIKEPERSRALKDMEQRALNLDETQIFMETPYRNNQLLKDLLRLCHKNTRLCIAANLTSAKEYIQTNAIKEWANSTVDFHKVPAVFLLGK